jgi:alkanesulfonate monooxygenase SsuD/methylene tetrahydromethanopterin reductase-like flavin-dependent oxidoreductase (luciferase family)
MPGATFVLGDTDEEATEKAAEIRRQQVPGQTAIVFLEQLWGRDLTAYDPDGHFPDVDPEPESDVTLGRVRHGDRLATAAKWRALAQKKGLTIRETVIELTGRHSFIGSAETVAASIDEFVRTDASDGFILVPRLTPGGLDEFVERVVPLLQERDSFRTEYEGRTLRDHLGLSQPAWGK